MCSLRNLLPSPHFQVVTHHDDLFDLCWCIGHARIHSSRVSSKIGRLPESFAIRLANPASLCTSPIRYFRTGWRLLSISKKTSPGSLRQKEPVVRQHFLKSLPEPQGQRSFRPSFSSSSLSPWTILTPRLTCDSDGNPRRRLLVGSKGFLFVEVMVLHGTPPILESWTTCARLGTHLAVRG